MKSYVPRSAMDWLLALCAGLVVIDLAYHRHGYFAFETWPGVPAILALVGALMMVAVARALAPLLQSREDTNRD